MRQNDIFKNFNHPRWATSIICGFLLGSAGDFAMKFLPATQRSSGDPLRLLIPGQEGSHPTNPTGDPRDPWDSPSKRSRPYRCSAVERPLMSGCCDTRYSWDRYDNSGSRQTAAEEARVICQCWYIRYDVYTQFMFTPYI